MGGPEKRKEDGSGEAGKGKKAKQPDTSENKKGKKTKGTGKGKGENTKKEDAKKAKDGMPAMSQSDKQLLGQIWKNATRQPKPPAQPKVKPGPAFDKNKTTSTAKPKPKKS